MGPTVYELSTPTIVRSIDHMMNLIKFTLGVVKITLINIKLNEKPNFVIYFFEFELFRTEKLS